MALIAFVIVAQHSRLIFSDVASPIFEKEGHASHLANVLARTIKFILVLYERVCVCVCVRRID